MPIANVFDHMDGTENQFIDGNVDHSLNNKCVKCPFLECEVANLKKEILNLTVEHDIEVRKLQRKIELLENKNEQKIDQVKQFRKVLSKEKNEVIRLKDIVAELKSQNFISSEDEKILNVCMVLVHST